MYVLNKLRHEINPIFVFYFVFHVNK